MNPTEFSQLPLEISFEAMKLIDGVVIVDCRTKDEFDSGHLEGALNLPLQQVCIQNEDLPCNQDDAIAVYCRSGNRSFTFATYLRSIGYPNCQSIEGGIETWGEREKC